MPRTAQSVSSRTDPSSTRPWLTPLAKQASAAEAVLVSSLPRGGLQIVQPSKIADAFLKDYNTAFQTHDAASWEAIAHGAPARADESGTYVEQFLSNHGYRFAVSIPLADPVFEGYGGAVQILRTAEQGDFSDAEIRKISDGVRQMEKTMNAARAARGAEGNGSATWRQRPAIRQWIFDGDAKLRLFENSFQQLDSRIGQQMLQQVRQRLSHPFAEAVRCDRVLLADSDGDHWDFNAVAYQQYPALGSGPFVFFCLQPGYPEWAAVRPADFQADAELSRLIPALKFMQQEFRRGPTLTDISRSVHLSPFHFHRRFTELLGLTPKHFLLQCQIYDAKKQLLAGKALAKIAADCGFAHQSHFTSRFKQTTGLTPTRWRRLGRQRVASAGH